MKNREIAATLGISVRAVEDNLRKGRETLEQKVGADSSLAAVPLTVCACDLSKQLSSIQSCIKGIELTSGESLRSRVIDARNYLVFLLANFIEQEENSGAKD